MSDLETAAAPEPPIQSPIQPLIRFLHVSRRYGEKRALDNVTLDIPRGGVFGLVGENGAGKTTLLKHVLGLLRPEDNGVVRVFGLDPAGDPVGVLSKIGYLSEDRDLPDWMRVGELLRYQQAFYPSWDEVYAGKLAETFALDMYQHVGGLSRGQRALAGLLIALAHRPPLLLLDEPSSGLDPVVRREILAAIIRTVGDEGRTVVFSSHFLDEIERVCDRVGMMHEGRLVLCDDLDTIRAAHSRVTLRFREAIAAGAQPALNGALMYEGESRDWTVLCDGRLEELKAAAAAQGAEIVNIAAATLDEIFVARVKG